MEQRNAQYERNVFLNCPFDEDYQPLLKALVFTLIYCGFVPRIASERADSGEVRFLKIVDLIKESRYGIHDLSRMGPLGPNELPRFNMPFELGVDIGARLLGSGTFSAKRCLILDRDRYRYQRALSDIAGQDIKAHNLDPETLVRQVRNWLVECGNKSIPSGTTIWDAYNLFHRRLDALLEAQGFKERDIKDMPLREFIDYVYRL